MSLHYCEHCQQMEGKTREDYELKEIVCADCGEPITHVPEHDDLEER